jgi:eukaryotic-like serine/threonine-protein kinase
VDRRRLFEAKMANPIPEKIGKYKVIGRLGQGGMGTVYKAHDPNLDRLVAIKILAGGLTDDPAYRQRFYREAQATANLRHPNIVTIYDLGEHEDRPYLVMEYLEGHTLDGSWSWQGFELAQKLNVVIGVCHGLQHAHQRGVVHRDIKPGNVMVLGDGTPKIVDFGLAHIAQSGDRNLTRTGQIMGSLNYMSPEQVQGLPGDPRSDIFSTGVVLYELVTGNSPFKSDNDFETLSKVLKQEPPSLGKFLLGYPPRAGDRHGQGDGEATGGPLRNSGRFGTGFVAPPRFGSLAVRDSARSAQRRSLTTTADTSSLNAFATRSGLGRVHSSSQPPSRQDSRV